MGAIRTTRARLRARKEVRAIYHDLINDKGEIAPGAERRRVPFGGRPQFRQAPSVRRWRTVGVFMAPLAHLTEFDRRGHKKPAPRKGRGRMTQLGGERGIRTPGTVTRTHAFQARSFSHSDTSPGVQLSRGGLIVGLQR